MNAQQFQALLDERRSNRRMRAPVHVGSIVPGVMADIEASLVASRRATEAWARIVPADLQRSTTVFVDRNSGLLIVEAHNRAAFERALRAKNRLQTEARKSVTFDRVFVVLARGAR